MAELVDRFPITCRPVRDLLVRYLEERASAMDYAIKLAENVQQQLNDTFVHTTWPACPLHPQHRSGSTASTTVLSGAAHRQGGHRATGSLTSNT